MMETKKSIQSSVDSLKGELLELSHYIHENPELGLKEYKASSAICDLLEKHGFSVTRGIGTLETAFMASVEGKEKGPHIAICAEYDALAGIGHGCGHNIIATCAVGAFLDPELLLEQPALDQRHGYPHGLFLRLY